LPGARDLVTLAVVVAVMTVAACQVALALLERRRLSPATVIPATVWLGWVAAASSVAAGVLHVAVVEDHAEAYLPFGIAFALLAAFQLAWPLVYLRRPSRPAALLAIVVNSGAIAVWVWSRTIGLPIGPVVGEVEAVGVVDSVTTALELVLVLGLLPTVRGGDRSTRSLRPGRAVVAACVATGMVAFAMLVGLFSLSGPV
jgi:hypothetical protein